MNLICILCALSTKSTCGTKIQGFSNHRIYPLGVKLRPVCDRAGVVTGIAVAETIFDSGVRGHGTLAFSAPVTYAAVTHVADRIQSLSIRDQIGEVPMNVTEDPPAAGGFPYYRHWRATRDVKYPVIARYVALVQPPGSPGGPAFGIRPSGGGVSGSGGGFLMLPENGGTNISQVQWDLSGLPKGSVGSCSFGDGAFELPGSPDKLTDGWYLAGPAHHFSLPGKASFTATWLGEPSFDAPEAMAWAAQAYQVLGDNFEYLKPVPRFRVFMRVLDTPPFGGGTALYHSFMLSMGVKGPRGSSSELRTTFFHEMTHQWVGGIEGYAPGESAWFDEGLTVYYTTVLPLRSGLRSVDDYAQLLNQQAQQYYTNAARNWSGSKIAQIEFGDDSIRHAPYVRGALYFSELDVQIRVHSSGKRNLDIFLRPMFFARQRGAKFDQRVWEKMLEKELGTQAVTEFREELIDGTKTVVPESGAFGPGFVRQQVQLKRADGTMVDGYQWARVPGLSDDQCRKW